jgi:hypothetical protein
MLTQPHTLQQQHQMSNRPAAAPPQQPLPAAKLRAKRSQGATDGRTDCSVHPWAPLVATYKCVAWTKWHGKKVIWC